MCTRVRCASGCVGGFLLLGYLIRLCRGLFFFIYRSLLHSSCVARSCAHFASSYISKETLKETLKETHKKVSFFGLFMTLYVSLFSTHGMAPTCICPAWRLLVRVAPRAASYTPPPRLWEYCVPPNMSNETNLYVKRDLYICGMRPTTQNQSTIQWLHLDIYESVVVRQICQIRPSYM